MAETLKVKGFTAELLTAQGHLVEQVILDRLERGASTPLYMETDDGHQTDLVEVHSRDDYVMEFTLDGDPLPTSDAIARGLKEADRVIEERGYIRLTVEDPSL